MRWGLDGFSSPLTPKTILRPWQQASNELMKVVAENPKRVLVVDDMEIIADTTVMILLKAGLNAVAVYDPNRALMFAQHGSFDLLLTDVVMPKMSGIELAIRVTDSGYINKVLLMAGALEANDLLTTAQSRGYKFDTIPKPVPPCELIDKVRAVLALAQARQ